MGERPVLLLEPFYCGSHKQLIDLLHGEIKDSELYTLPGKKWHWKARTSALYLSQEVPRENSFRILFASSVLNLAELVALRPDLGRVRKVVYFHENQLVYPVRKQQGRDFQYGYNQIISCLVADKVVFNSKYNMESFLSSINTFLKLIPDHRPKGIPDLIRPKCCVLNFPIKFPLSEAEPKNMDQEKEANELDHGTSPSCKTESNCTCRQSIDPQQTVASSKDIKESPDIPCSERIMTDNINDKIQDTERLEMDSVEGTYDDLSSRSRNKDMDIRGTGLTYDDLSVKEDRVAQSTKKSLDGDCGYTKSHKGTSSVDRKSDIENQVIKDKPLHIVWPHRWEHDKGPESFFKIMFQLDDLGLHFHLSVLGEQFSDVPDIFTEAKRRLGTKILHWGYQETKEEYFDILREADCVVSTAHHEFFGVAMLEAVNCGCYPLCPNRLVYPEIFSGEYLYNTENQMLKKLHQFCKRPSLCRNNQLKIDVQQYSWKELMSSYKNLLTPE